MAASSGDVREMLATAARAVDSQLERYIDALTADCPDRLREAMRYSLLAPGKRMRPALVQFGCQALGGHVDSAWPAACAIEMIHTYSLIHDDLPAMDDDDLRRGRLTCHKQFDEATAILAGDALLTLAFEVLARDVQPASAAVACCVELASAAGAEGMVGGQMADLEAETSPISTGEALESIHRRKTGRLLTASVVMGGRIAQASPQGLSSLRRYGAAVGLAFQIADDLLDVESTPEKMGKNVRKDAQLGKLTYPVLWGVEESRRRAEGLTEEALSAIEPFGAAAQPLADLAKFIVTRDH
ncbi:MAG: polyprenyl synthetase family protein [Planctomycetaceae bacterium]